MPTKPLRENIRFILIGAVLLVLFYAFSFLVKEDFFVRFDFDTTVRIQDFVPRTIDSFFSYFSLLGSFEAITGILLVLIAVRRKIQGVFSVGAYGLMHVVELVGKAFLDHPATPFMFHRYSFDFIFPTGYVQPGGSYPSGHAMRSAYLAVLLLFISYRSNKLSKLAKFGIWCLVLGTLGLMLFSRVSLGEHWTTDVIGGSILGAAFAFFSLVLL